MSTYNEFNSPLGLRQCYLALHRWFEDSDLDCTKESLVLSSLIIYMFTFTKRAVQRWEPLPLSTEHCAESNSIYLELV